MPGPRSFPKEPRSHTGVDLSFYFEKEWKRNFSPDGEVGFWEWRVRG